MQNENIFQASLIRTIKNILPGSMVFKLDANYIQGIPDLLILYGYAWAVLECKKTKTASHRPNQDFYINKMNAMSFAAFIYPENTEYILQKMVNHLIFVNDYINQNKDLKLINKMNEDLTSFISNYDVKPNIIE